jgi:hypothetical protein
MTITIESSGRRHYIVGDTYGVRAEIKSAGAHWDHDRRAWWLGDRKKAEALVASLASAGSGEKRDHEAPGLDATVAGRAQYKGKSYYIAGRSYRDPYDGYRSSVRAVTSRDGTRVLLYARDGSFEFWAPTESIEQTSTYQRPRTIRSLREYAEQARRAQETGECATCEHNFAQGRWAPYRGSGDYDTCHMCGATVQIMH